MKPRQLFAGLLRAGLVAGLALALTSQQEAVAADHAEAPIAAMNPHADILDFYAWHKDDGKIVAIITYYSFIEAQIGEPQYSNSVVYGIHIDNNMDNAPDETVWVRFGQNSMGEWGMQLTGLPGVGGSPSGPVNTPMDVGPGTEQAWAGLADDPFFFDVQGFGDTLMSGTLSFDNTRDGFANFNVMAIVVEISQDAASAGNNQIQMWASTYQ